MVVKSLAYVNSPSASSFLEELGVLPPNPARDIMPLAPPISALFAQFLVVFHRFARNNQKTHGKCERGQERQAG